MNDLERDLQNLFEQRARDVEPAGLPPEAIIRRGHRRQARTVLGGAVAGIVAIVGLLLGVDVTGGGGGSGLGSLQDLQNQTAGTPAVIRCSGGTPTKL